MRNINTLLSKTDEELQLAISAFKQYYHNNGTDKIAVANHIKALDSFMKIHYQPLKNKGIELHHVSAPELKAAYDLNGMFEMNEKMMKSKQ